MKFKIKNDDRIFNDCFESSLKQVQGKWRWSNVSNIVNIKTMAICSLGIKDGWVSDNYIFIADKEFSRKIYRNNIKKLRNFYKRSPVDFVQHEIMDALEWSKDLIPDPSFLKEEKEYDLTFVASYMYKKELRLIYKSDIGGVILKAQNVKFVLNNFPGAVFKQRTYYCSIQKDGKIIGSISVKMNNSQVKQLIKLIQSEERTEITKEYILKKTPVHNFKSMPDSPEKKAILKYGTKSPGLHLKALGINPGYVLSEKAREAGVITDSYIIIFDKKVQKELYDFHHNNLFIKELSGKTEEEAKERLLEYSEFSYPWDIFLNRKFHSQQSKFTGKINKVGKDHGLIFKDPSLGEFVIDAKRLSLIRKYWPVAEIRLSGWTENAGIFADNNMVAIIVVNKVNTEEGEII